MEAYVILKSYGIRVYSAIMKPISLSAILEALEEGALTEITPGNFHAVSHPDKQNVVECTPSALTATLIEKEAL
jgi:predicted Fe-Mo cluster-binding NifX family protein